MKDKLLNFDIEGNFDIVSKSKKDRVIAGYCSVTIIDSDDELITKEALIKGLETLLEDDGFYANIMVTHSNIQVGRVLTEYQNYKTHVDDNGLFIVVKIREKLDIANDIWQQILDGKINGFSVAGTVSDADKEKVCNDVICWTQINKINLFEVSLTSSPVNKASRFEVISKSHSHFNDICNDVSKTEKSEDDKSGIMENKKTICEKKQKTLSEYIDKVKKYLIDNPEAEVEDALKSLQEELVEDDEVEEKSENEEAKTEEEKVVEEAKSEDETTKEETVEEKGEEVEEKQVDEDEEDTVDDEDNEEEETIDEEIEEETKQNIGEFVFEKMNELLKAIQDEYGVGVEKSNNDFEAYKEEMSKSFAEFKSEVMKEISTIKSIEEKNNEIDELQKSNESLKDMISVLEKSNKELEQRLEVVEKSEKPPKTKVEIKQKSLSDDVEHIYTPHIVSDARRKIVGRL